MQKARLLIVVLCLALLIAPVSGLFAQDPAGDIAFATPEDAIAHFFEGLIQGDLGTILQSSAIDEMSENFAFDLYVDRLRAFMPIQSFAPADYPLYVEINRAEITARLSTQVKLLSYSLLAGDEIELDRTTIMELEGAQNLVLQVDPSRLAQLEVIEVSLPNPTAMSSDRYKENMLRLAVTYGADEATERVALVSFEDNDYLLGFSFLRYSDNWKISSLNSPLAGTTVLGAATLTTREEFAELTS